MIDEGIFREEDLKKFAQMVIERYSKPLTIEYLSPRTVLSKATPSIFSIESNVGVLKDPELIEMLKDFKNSNLIKEAQELIQESKDICLVHQMDGREKTLFSESLGLKALQIVEALVDSHKIKQEQEKKKHTKLAELAKKIEALINPTCILPEERKADLREKLTSLENHLGRAKEQVDNYKKNCQLLADMVIKQPHLVTNDALNTALSIGIFKNAASSSSIENLRVITALEDAQKTMNKSEITPSIAPAISSGDNSLNLQRINSRSVIHSYLNRSPAIVRHIGCAGNDLTRLLRLVS